MAHVSDPRLLVLHALRLKGFAEPAVVAASSGLDPGEVEALLKELEVTEHALHREGRVTGWALTREGRREHAALLAAELDAARARTPVADAYRRFLVVNPDLLAACTDWQVRATDGAQVVNDHGDVAYDERVVDRLRDVHERVRPVLDDLSASLARYGRYRPRLDAALERITEGEGQWFTRPLIDSYHTVWFELHEDLLATLGLERTTEAMG